MKNRLSPQLFKIFIGKLPIVKQCFLEEKNKAVIELNNGASFSVSIVISETGYPKQIKDIISKIKADIYTVIIAPYISEQTADLCLNANVGYMDQMGNCNIVCGSLYVEIKGNKNQNASKRALKSIYERSSVVSSAILMTMLANCEKVWKMKELADAAGSSIGQVAKVKEFLLNQAFIEQTKNGFRLSDPRALMRNWAEIYKNGSEEEVACYSLDDVATIEAKLSKMKDDIGIECILTGFSGGSRYQPVVRYNKVHVYVEPLNIEQVISYLGLKKVDSGANIILIIPYNNCIGQNARFKKDNMVASPVQLYLDCMSMKGRGEEMAEAILDRVICDYKRRGAEEYL